MSRYAYLVKFVYYIIHHVIAILVVRIFPLTSCFVTHFRHPPHHCLGFVYPSDFLCNIT